jgi:hypothetical protein
MVLSGRAAGQFEKGVDTGPCREITRVATGDDAASTTGGRDRGAGRTRPGDAQPRPLLGRAWGDVRKVALQTLNVREPSLI